MKIIFATNNLHKIKEINSVIDIKYTLVGLEDAGIREDIPEEEDTLEGNALSKARFVYNRTGLNVFADDTGLEVEALDNRPGVSSARYAGEEKDSEKNIDKLLSELNAKSNRKARFRTIIAAIIEGEEYLFEGKVVGAISEERKGNMGFGYDSVFKPDKKDKTFAEMNLEEKNTISHRAKALKKFSGFLDKYKRQ